MRIERYGFDEQATRLRQSIVELVEEGSFYEYFDPTDGKGRGSVFFSWTAALLLDVLIDDKERIVVQLENKVAIVTGASLDISRAIAIAFAKEGAAFTVDSFTVDYRSHPDEVKEVVI